jgi:hypothetical protein
MSRLGANHWRRAGSRNIWRLTVLACVCARDRGRKAGPGHHEKTPAIAALLRERRFDEAAAALREVVAADAADAEASRRQREATVRPFPADAVPLIAALMVSESRITRHHQACGWPGALPRFSTPTTSRLSPPTRLTCAHSNPSAGSAVSENSHRHKRATTDGARFDSELDRRAAMVSIVSNLRTGFAARSSSGGSLAPARRRQTTSTNMRLILLAGWLMATPRNPGRPPQLRVARPPS